MGAQVVDDPVLPCASAEFDLSLRCLKLRLQSYTRTWSDPCLCAKVPERAAHPFGIRVLKLKRRQCEAWRRMLGRVGRVGSAFLPLDEERQPLGAGSANSQRLPREQAAVG